MVLLQFPSSLTEEELSLQAKYAKLKKKKKQVQALKSGSASSEDSKVGRGVSVGKRGAAGPKGLGESKDAKEVAKKLQRTGKNPSVNVTYLWRKRALSKIQKSVEKEKTEKSSGFKRSQGLERKLTSLETRPSFQPFSATHGPGGGFDTGGEDMNPEPPEPAPKKVKNLYESFVHARDREERGLNDRERGSADKPRQGNTIYVFGYNITEDLLRGTFGTHGKIVNISMELEKSCGFVTFEKPESAEVAISGQNGAIVQGIQLKVSMARRQPVIEPINDASSSATWSTLAASHSQKGSHKDKRDLVAYDVDMF